jgi:hypothetical protein
MFAAAPLPAVLANAAAPAILALATLSAVLANAAAPAILAGLIRHVVLTDDALWRHRLSVQPH